MAGRLVTLLAAMLPLPTVAAWAADLPVWRHGIIQPKSDAGFATLPADPRFAGPEGIGIRIVPVQSDQVGLKALLAGELDSFEGGPNSAVVAAAHGADLRIIGCAWPGLVHGIFVRDDVHTLADLKGKAIAISAPGSMPDFAIRAALRKAGIPVGAVQLASLGSDTDRFKALSAGVVSAAVISSEYVPLLPPGVHELVSVRDVLPDFPRGCVVTTEAVLSHRRPDAVRFMAAEIAGVRHALSDRSDELAATIVATHVDPADPRPGYLYDEAKRMGAVDGDMNVSPAAIHAVGALLVSAGILKAMPDTDAMVDPTVRADALRRLGGG